MQIVSVPQKNTLSRHKNLEDYFHSLLACNIEIGTNYDSLLSNQQDIQKAIQTLFDYGFIRYKSNTWELICKPQIDELLSNPPKHFSKNIQKFIKSYFKIHSGKIIEMQKVPSEYLDFLGIKNTDTISFEYTAKFVDETTKTELKIPIENGDSATTQQYNFAQPIDVEIKKNTQKYFSKKIQIAHIELEKITPRREIQKTVVELCYRVYIRNGTNIFSNSTLTPFKNKSKLIRKTFAKTLPLQKQFSKNQFDLHLKEQHILIASQNPIKVEILKDYLSFPGLVYNSISKKTLEDFEVHELGYSETDNARIKAFSYFEKYNTATLGMDIGLYFDGIEDENQPGSHIKRIALQQYSPNDKVMYETMIEFYRKNYVQKYGKNGRLKGKLVYAFSLFDGREYQDFKIDQDIILSDTPHRKKDYSLPLLSMIISPKHNTYYFDLTLNQLNEFYAEFASVRVGLGFGLFSGFPKSNTSDRGFFPDKSSNIKSLLAAENPKSQVYFSEFHSSFLTFDNSKSGISSSQFFQYSQQKVVQYSKISLPVSSHQSISSIRMPFGFFESKKGENQISFVYIKTSSKNNDHIFESMYEQFGDNIKITVVDENFNYMPKSDSLFIEIIKNKSFSTVIGKNDLLQKEKIVETGDDLIHLLEIQKMIHSFGINTVEKTKFNQIRKTSLEQSKNNSMTAQFLNTFNNINEISIQKNSDFRQEVKWENIRNENGKLIGIRDTSFLLQIVQKSVEIILDQSANFAIFSADDNEKIVYFWILQMIWKQIHPNYIMKEIKTYNQSIEENEFSTKPAQNDITSILMWKSIGSGSRLKSFSSSNIEKQLNQIISFFQSQKPFGIVQDYKMKENRLEEEFAAYISQFELKSAWGLICSEFREVSKNKICDTRRLNKFLLMLQQVAPETAEICMYLLRKNQKKYQVA